MQSIHEIKAEFRHRILVKLILAFVPLLLVTLNLVGWYFYEMTKRHLDDELGVRLMAIAASATALIDPERLRQLEPGDEGTVLYHLFQSELRRLGGLTKVENIYILDRHNRYVVDASGKYAIGARNPIVMLDSLEIDSVHAGNTVASVTYQGADGRFYKSGYAPIVDEKGETVVAVMGVDASAHFFDVIRQIRRGMFVMGALSVLSAVAISMFFARSLVKPIRTLVKSAKALGAGDLSARANLRVRDEIGFLGAIFDEMAELLNARDKTLKRLYEQRISDLAQLSAGLAHEIRNPLGAMQGFIGLLQRRLRENHEAEKQLAGQIEKEIQNLNQIVTEFLQFAHPQPPQMMRVDVNEIIEGALLLSQTEDRTERPDVIIKKEMMLQSPFVMGDFGQLQRVFLNLIKNAIEAMPAGGTLVIASQVIENGGTQWVQVDLTDSGVGIAPDVGEQLFTPFFTTKDTGTGLGLSIAHRILEVHGASITFHSEGKERGTTFRIRLPVAKGEGNEQNSRR